MTKIYWEKDVNSNALRGKTVAILGYGSQGRAHALNLKDSGVKVVVGLRRGGKTWKQAITDGFEPVEFADAVQQADVVALLMPDMAQPEVYQQAVATHIKKNATLVFAHGFNIHYKEIAPRADLDVVLIAPKGPGGLVRRQYEEGFGVPALVAVHQDASGKALETALAYAHGIGGTRAGVIETTFAEETETDLFGEQAVLCGGATELVVNAWETLVEAGYRKEVAYFECMHELKLIVDLLYEGGLARMHEFISDTAKYGDLTRGPRVIDQHVRENMKNVLTEIRNGTFAKEWIAEHRAGSGKYRALLDKDMNHPIEKTGSELRQNMSWINKSNKSKAADKRELAPSGVSTGKR